MRTPFLTLALLNFSIFLTGCGTDAETVAKSSNSSSNGKTPVAVNVDPNVVNNPQTANSADVNSVTEPNSNSDIAQISNVSDMRQAKLDKLKSGTGGPAPAGAEPLRREAPDNSQYWSVLTDVAVETRQFRDNAQINKVEKINNGQKSIIRIYLKTGKLVEVPGERVADLSRESVTTFITLAGLKPPAAPQPPPSGEAPPEKTRSVRIFPKAP